MQVLHMYFRFAARRYIEQWHMEHGSCRFMRQRLFGLNGACLVWSVERFSRCKELGNRWLPDELSSPGKWLLVHIG